MKVQLNEKSGDLGIPKLVLLQQKKDDDPQSSEDFGLRNNVTWKMFSPKNTISLSTVGRADGRIGTIVVKQYARDSVLRRSLGKLLVNLCKWSNRLIPH